jgi:hypothetical protein
VKGEHRPAEVASRWALFVQREAAQLKLPPGEASELLERLQFVGSGGEALWRWERRLARRALQAYAARKRAVVRLARQGRL